MDEAGQEARTDIRIRKRPVLAYGRCLRDVRVQPDAPGPCVVPSVHALSQSARPRTSAYLRRIARARHVAARRRGRERLGVVRARAVALVPVLDAGVVVTEGSARRAALRGRVVRERDVVVREDARVRVNGAGKCEGPARGEGVRRERGRHAVDRPLEGAHRVRRSVAGLTLGFSAGRRNRRRCSG